MIISCNEAEVIEACLQSVAEWVDEIVVVDMHSTDSTREVVRRYTDRLIDHERLDYADPARNFALDQAKGDWTVMLDPDERVPPKLGRALRIIAAENVADVVHISRQQVMFGRVVQSPGTSDHAHPRFFRSGLVSWPAEVHGSPDLSGLREQRLPADDPDLALLHDTWRSIPIVLDKITRYAPKDVENLLARGERFTFWGMVRGACDQLVGRIVGGRAYQDGMAGLLTALYFAIYHLTIQAELWEAEGRPTTYDRSIERWVGGASRVLLMFGRVARAAEHLLRGRSRYQLGQGPTTSLGRAEDGSEDA